MNSMSILLKSILVGISILAIIILTSKLKLNAFIALFLVSLFLAFATLPANTIVNYTQGRIRKYNGIHRIPHNTWSNHWYYTRQNRWNNKYSKIYSFKNRRKQKCIRTWQSQVLLPDYQFFVIRDS